jgi:hypothetical protein
MRRYIPALLLSLAAFGPFALTGCNDLISKLKGGGDDAGEAPDSKVATTPADNGDAPAGTATATATAEPTPMPTEVKPTPTLTTTVRAPVVTDAGKATVDAAAPAVVDAGAKPAPADAGPAPAPTPTLRLANFFDGGLRFDAGGFKPPWVR